MSKKKALVKGGAPIQRIRENSRLMRTHESMVDYLNGRQSSYSFLDVLAPTLFGFHFGRPFEDDLIYSDEDDDDDDDDYDFSHSAPKKSLEPHPQIKQLTEEEAEKIAKELIEEEERTKGKTQKNKRKKMRKKEKKRLEKENAVKEIVAEEEQGKSDSSENLEGNAIIKSVVGGNKSSLSGKSQNAPMAAGCDENGDNSKETNPVKKKDEEQMNLDLNNSYAPSAKSVPEVTCNKKPTKDGRKEKSKSPQVRQPAEGTPEAAEKPKEEQIKIAEKPEKKKTEVKEKPEEDKPKIAETLEVRKKPEASKEKTMDSVAEEFAKRSIELASMGNRLASAGQFEMAVGCFTDAIKYNPKEYKLFGNRSLCYERLLQYENALRDADVALTMEPNWIKGLFRKGKALCGLKRYYEASLIYKEVLRLESTSAEAAQELKRAQTLHLMEMGFNWAQSSEALKSHATLEEAVEALFAADGNRRPPDAGASRDLVEQPAVQLEDSEDIDDGEWIVLQPSRSRTQQVRESDALGQSRSKSQSPTPVFRSAAKPPLFPVWVGSLNPAVTYVKLHEVFSRTGTVYSIKMLLEQECAFVNYLRKEDSDRAIQCLNGMVVEGSPLSVRYPFKVHPELGVSKSALTDPTPRPAKKECFFWRTTGCTRDDCTFKHIPEHKNIDKERFTSRLGCGGFRK